MRTEARNNLIFFILLVALSVPGVVMLVRKKLSQPPTDQMGFASPARVDIPYVDPIPVGSGIRLIYPPRLRQWVRTLDERAPADAARISRQRSFEVVRTARPIEVLIWDPRIDVRGLAFDLDDRPLTIGGSSELAVPAEVLSELRQLGYLAPPESIPRITLEAPTGGDGGGEILRLRGVRAGEPFADELNLRD